MSLKRFTVPSVLSCVMCTGFFGVADATAAAASGHYASLSEGSRHGSAWQAHSGGFRSAHASGHGANSGAHWGGGRGSGGHWGWGLGVAIGVPWALGWYDPWFWGPAYYPPYVYGPVYRSYGAPCDLYEDCRGEFVSPITPPAPTTEVAPTAPGESGGPTKRPLHLNYCEPARAWFPQVRTCPGGWRFVPPEYNASP